MGHVYAVQVKRSRGLWREETMNEIIQVISSFAWSYFINVKTSSVKWDMLIVSR